jgi:hypothetical protein
MFCTIYKFMKLRVRPWIVNCQPKEFQQNWFYSILVCDSFPAPFHSQYWGDQRGTENRRASINKQVRSISPFFKDWSFLRTKIWKCTPRKWLNQKLIVPSVIAYAPRINGHVMCFDNLKILGQFLCPTFGIGIRHQRVNQVDSELFQFQQALTFKSWISTSASECYCYCGLHICCLPNTSCNIGCISP